ncbi:GGDEF domain-containing protein [Salinisphaera sp.]|uniref:GGDEF domain-containing protein n=1 Tax=Salinisphaera sp. TaxID=1914330 RepID=UPI002D78772B|nr:GGDEF domain-containing protein [Salinisphaera sp.]HET7313389.1 GGDEF domain-containing protein [Salinisphaera sp.]
MTPSSKTTETVAAASERRFWQGQLYAALAGYATVIATALGYITLTWSQPHRPGILALTVAAGVVGLGCYGARKPIVASRRRVLFFAAWNIMSFLMTEVICVLDGGVSSPLVYLLVLPMVYLAVGYPMWAAVACGAAGLIGFGGLVLFTSHDIDAPVVLIQGMVLVIGWLLALLGAAIRERQAEALAALHRQLETDAATDALTGCLNQRAFTEAIGEMLEHCARYRRPLALLLIDIDHFKHINDMHGHLMGDAVLRHLGTKLRATARVADHVGRPGGDEFALLAPETDIDAARALAERLRAAMAPRALPVDITLSIGVCAIVPNGESSATLFRRADQALYAAKRGGRDRVAACADEVDEPPIAAAHNI